MFEIITAQGQDKTYGRLQDARKRADKLAVDGAEVLVRDVETDAVTYVVNAQALAAGYFTPRTRVETPRFEAPALTGWVPAYTRKRIEATVYRSTESHAWLIHDGRTGGTIVVANTKQACETTSAMRHGLLLDA